MVRLGQFSSAQSREIKRTHASSYEIRSAGAKAILAARESRRVGSSALPCERQHRKRSHDVRAFYREVNNAAKDGPEWQVAGMGGGEDSQESEEEEDSESDAVTESSSDEE